MIEPLMQARGLHKHYGRRTPVRALDGLDLDILPGRSVGIAGETGSGKSTLLRLLLALEPATEGSVTFHDGDVQGLDAGGERRFRAAVQAVFQDPASSFDPRHRVWRLVTEPAWIAEKLNKRQRIERAHELLASVDLSSAHSNRFPHQLSGGERQRVAIARALSSQPELVLLDEPVTSLDISVRGHIINLLRRKAQQNGLTYVVVSHDLTAIFHLTDELHVMYEGVVVESGPTATVIAEPLHPYTQTLVAAVENPLQAPEVDQPPAPAGACPFMSRCPHAQPRCEHLPELRSIDETRTVRCVLHEPSAPRPVDAANDDPAASPATRSPDKDLFDARRHA